ncbi:Hint domain-containing protein [Pseudooceanicola pacificus]|nr:Hint domain-containing protein [Pseudooceanicola pacificus]
MKPNTATRAAADVKGAKIQGIAAGTKVLTLDGELPVEFLNAGDRVITRDSGMAVLRDIRVRTVKVAAVAIAASSLGHDRPEADMVLPAGQQVLVRDWRAQALFGQQQAMVPVSRLADGQFVRHIGEVEMRVFELRFDRDHVIYAGGMELAAPAPASAPA